jgi:hypothetical protein
MSFNYSSAETQKALERMREHNQKRLDGIRARIADRETKGLNCDDLRRELSQARATAEAGEKLAEDNLSKAKEREAAQAARDQAVQEAARAEIDVARKVRASRVWVANGGDPAEFETAWPTIRRELLQTATLAGTAKVEETGLDFRGL